ncbi:uncharacterized protein LOC128667789 [Microplitis demolitor]|uniref:uncharacterized protein LOC128667789 n=1 Tax=Microplitis demolitor TaxID=69319 RepID=UPI00235B6ACA|nr:uncharacterized protein LOC128667789 [Microplitis demolitor]
MWTKIEKLIGDKKKSSEIFDSISFNNRYLKNELDIANGFNRYFVNSIKHIIKEVESNDVSTGYNHKELVDNFDNSKIWGKFDEVSVLEVEKIINNLDVNKGANNDLNAVIVKKIWDCNRNIILSMLDCSLNLGIVPNCWKVSVITPISKIKNSDKAENFRPINTLPILKQILERIVKTQLEKFIEDNVISDVGQSCYRKYFSCESALQDLLTKWRKDLDDGMWIRIIFIDFTRAFETVDRKVLIDLLRKIGLRGIVLD